jgi:hypothetical protein
LQDDEGPPYLLIRQMPRFFAQSTLSEMTKILLPQPRDQDDSEWAQNNKRGRLSVTALAWRDEPRFLTSARGSCQALLKETSAG